MKSIFLKNNIKYPSIEKIEEVIRKLKQVKKSSGINVNNIYIKSNIRRGSILNLLLLSYNSDVNVFEIGGIIKKKNKKNNINNSITLKMRTSGVDVYINLHLYFDGMRLE